ncbi:MAG: hypothetical protein QXM22_02915 [Candidatus Bathyarchaeia archaeon]
MARLKKIPLANGLLVSEADFIHGQLEVSLVNYRDIEVVVNQKPYGGRSDVKLLISKKALSGMIDILEEAEEKLGRYWLSEFALRELKTTKPK